MSLVALQNLGRVLTDHKIIDQQRWVRAGGERPDATLDRVLSELQRIPAYYSSEFPSLTEYQCQRIRLRSGKSYHGLEYELKANRYLILSELGTGGMATVVRAWSLDQNREVAIKRIKGTDPQLRERQLREGRVLSRLQHPQVVRLLGCEPVDGGVDLLIVMEVVPGRTLRDVLVEGPPVAVDVAVDWIKQLLRVLEYTHSQGVIHRDLAPKNIMETEVESSSMISMLKVLDFGLSKIVGADDGLTGTQQQMGTLHYMSPEQFDATHSVTTATDIYSLGCVAYAILTGNPPFSNATVPKLAFKHSTNELPVAPVAIRPEIPSHLSMTVMKMLAKAPRDRGTIKELLAQLEVPAVTDSQEVTSEVTTPHWDRPEPDRPEPDRRGSAVVLVPQPKLPPARNRSQGSKYERPSDTGITSVSDTNRSLIDPEPAGQRIHPRVSLIAYFVPRSVFIAQTRHIDLEPGVADIYMWLNGIARTVIAIAITTTFLSWLAWNRIVSML